MDDLPRWLARGAEVKPSSATEIEAAMSEETTVEEAIHHDAEAAKLKREIIERYTPRSAIAENYGPVTDAGIAALRKRFPQDHEMAESVVNAHDDKHYKLIADLEEPRVGIHEDGTEELKTWEQLFELCKAAAHALRSSRFSVAGSESMRIIKQSALQEFFRAWRAGEPYPEEEVGSEGCAVAACSEPYASLSAREEKNELRLSDGGIDQPLRKGEPAAWLIERSEEVQGYGPARSVTLSNAEEPGYWLSGEIEKGYTVTPLYKRDGYVEKSS